jgi:arylsulfatase A-like enzyme
MHKKSRFLIGLVATLSSLSSLVTAAEAELAPKPNIILILVDDMGYSDLGCFGGEIKTPNLDTLAGGGIRFTQFTNNAKCETTRTALMSGQHHTVVSQDNHQRFYTIPESLSIDDDGDQINDSYQNFMVGKWHIFNTPMDRGFDRYFGFHAGASNFFNGTDTNGGFSYHLDDVKLAPSDLPDDFYSTDAFTDYAIQFVEERDKDRPFFIYVAYNAPHYPLQAPQADVEKYLDLEYYKDGWASLRTKRLARMKTLGVVPVDSALSAPESDVENWEDLSQAEKDDMELRMATYAAMVDRVDQQLARLITTLENEEIFDDTLIIFLSDNGACPFDRTRSDTKINNYMPWDERSYWCYPKEWANACNTPFRMYKQNQHEGGIAAPMIAHWPNGIDAELKGTFNRERGHVRDFHATFRELAGVTLPAERNGELILNPSASISFTPIFSGQPRPEAPYYYQYYSNSKTALVIDQWKLVNKKSLYDLDTDRIESNDLSATNPEKFDDMMTEWTRLDGQLNQSRASAPLSPPSDL